MPLVRAEVRNEYSLGAPELYREAKKEDPKEILEGVAVAGLVGVLRQLGDLADFAADVFHGLQEEVTRTSSRSHKLMARVQRIEAALSPLEKALLAQRSHLHFAYTAGSNWHTRIRCEQNHFIYSDLPQFIMDAYEDCRRTPSLHLLDKFDPGGPGSCLKRYSDPTFFKRTSVASGEASTAAEKILKDKKGHKIKKRRSWPRNGKVSRDASFSYNSGRRQLTQPNIHGHISPSQTASTTYEHDATLRSDLGAQSNLDLRNGSSYIEGDFRPSCSVEPEEQENLELRNSSSYIEGDFRPSYSVEPEEQESGESASYPIKRHESDFLDYNFLEGKLADSYDDIETNISQDQGGCSSYFADSYFVTLDEKRGTSEAINISQEQARFSSSSVTWDEKREMLEPTTEDSDNDGISQKEYHNNRHIEPFSPNLDRGTLSGNDPDFGTLDTTDAQPTNQAAQDQKSGYVHLDDIESETDFVDALNTIDSECETDIDCSKKLEVEHNSKLEERGGDDGVLEPMRHNSRCQLSSSESNVLASSPLGNDSHEHSPISMSPRSPYATSCSIIDVAAKDDLISVSLVVKDLQPSERTGDSVSLSSPQGIDSHDNDNPDAGYYVESVSSTASSKVRGDRPGISVTDGKGSNPDSQKQAPETSNVTSVTFWTNGGLLGLQPSKPPDCSLLNTQPQDIEFKQDGKISSSFQNSTLTDKDSWKRDQTEYFNNIEEGLDIDSSNCHEYQESGASFRKASWKISPADLDINLSKLVSSIDQNHANSTGSSVRASGIFLPAYSEFQADRKHQENARSSSQMFDLSNRSVSTGSNKKLLPGGVENSYTAEYKNANDFEQKNGPNVGYRKFSVQSKDLLSDEFPISFPSSPPLQHMKISFQPIDGFESSKLKLKFPDRNTNNENGIDNFPSFQLVPEVSSACYKGTDSDADTFYRSSPSLLDDCHSNQSESNSEQWDSSESPTEDSDLYDAFRRISVTESVSTVPENGRANLEDIHGNLGPQFPFLENGVQKSESFRSFDLQSSGAMNHSFRKELSNDANVEYLGEPQFVTAVPPPLPPVEWQGITPPPDGIEDKYRTMPDGLYYASNITCSASTISQPKPAPFSEDQIDTQKSKHSSSPKSNGQRESKRGKSIDESDFLHQIRTKSFNLRPIGAAKPTVPIGASATAPVSAILEKANAIRQAVGSDEDDGGWSDT